MVAFGIPEDRFEQAKMLENILMAACEGNISDSYSYEELRRKFMADATLKKLLPDFVRSCRDLGHFWGFIKGVSPKWEPRRFFVREALSRLFNHIEEVNIAPVDTVASDVLQYFDTDGVHKVWTKALERRHTDLEGAITSARTLLETVCKRILDESNETYSDRDDLPALYKSVASKLNIAPSQHTEDTFRRILGARQALSKGWARFETRSATLTVRGSGRRDRPHAMRNSP